MLEVVLKHGEKYSHQKPSDNKKTELEKSHTVLTVRHNNHFRISHLSVTITLSNTHWDPSNLILLCIHVLRRAE